MSSLAAPKSANEEPAAEEISSIGAPAAIEVIEPSTGEIIVLAQHKPIAPAKAAAEEQVTPLAKPEKRKNAKERSQGKLKTKPAEDDTTPETTATAKSDAGAQTGAGSGAKSAEVLAANEARKARKAADKAKLKAKPAAAKVETKAGAKLKKKAGR